MSKKGSRRKAQKKRPEAPKVPPVYAVAAIELKAIAAEYPEVELVAEPAVVGKNLVCKLRLSTKEFEPGPGGLTVGDFEKVTLTVTPDYPRLPPKATVDHERWLGYPHVLQGNRLCIFLDLDREWSPLDGMTGTLNRLWDWFDDAVAGRFDARTSLHHAVGGVDHHQYGAPLLVVRSAPDLLHPGIRKIVVSRRTDRRTDLVAWDRDPEGDELHGLAIVLPGPLHRGAGHTLSDLVGQIHRPVYSANEQHLERIGFPSATMLTDRIERAAHVVGAGQPLHIVVAARNLALDGPGSYDLIAATVAPDTLAMVTGHAPDGAKEPNLHYLRPDDTRPEIATRRDDRRPVGWFEGKTVELWGCGALGSWVAEILVRSGVKRLLLRDAAIVTSGLLVRQNYRETDVGKTKAEALAERLRALSDSVVIVAAGHGGTDVLQGALGACDMLIDATVSTSVTAALDAALTASPGPAIVAQVSTDSDTSTLGIVAMTPGDSGIPISSVDGKLREHAMAEPELEGYRTFWEADDGVLFAPARGCSTPTFRGSAADAMAIAASAVSLLGQVAPAGISGGYLFALPHASATVPAKVWLSTT